jgi:hypothetical protein
MNATQGLLLLYAGVILINTVVSAALWYERRDPLMRAQFFFWASSVFCIVMQAGATHNSFIITLGYSTVFLVSISISNLLVMVAEMPARWRLFFTIMGVGYALSLAAFLAGLSFFAVGLPVAVGVAFPTLYMAITTIASRWKTLTVSRKGLLLATLAHGVHTLDFPVLRDKPNTTVPVFTVGILIVFSLSIFIPAVVLEVVTQQRGSPPRWTWPAGSRPTSCPATPPSKGSISPAT